MQEPQNATEPERFDALPSRHRWLMFALPVGLALLVHARTLGFPFSGLDDGVHFRENPLVTAPGSQPLLAFLTTQRIGYPVPVTILSYLVDKAFVGIVPWRFHLTNLLLHSANVAGVVLLARKLGTTRAAATLAGAWFAVHPLVVEPVTWVTGRKDLLATFFALAALNLIVGRNDLGKTTRRWWAVGLATLLAMLSKPTTATLPGMIWTATGGRGNERARQRLLAVSALLFVLTASLVVVGVMVVRKQQPVGSQSLGDMALDVAGAWALSVSRVAWPVDLLPYYFRTSGDPSLGWMVLAGLVLVALIVTALRFTPRASPIRIGLAWAAWAYLPVAGFVGHYRWTADSYLYLPLVGLSIAAASAWEPALSRLSARLAFPLGLLAAVSLSALAFAQAEVWKSPERMWRAVAARYPSSPVPLKELAATLQWMGRDEEALRTIEELDERFPELPMWVAQRANARLLAGDNERARELFGLGLRSGDVPTALAYLDQCSDETLRVPCPAGVLRPAFELAWPTWSTRELDGARRRRLAERLALVGLDAEADRVRESR